MLLPTAPAVSGSRARLSTFGKMAASSSHFAGSAAGRAPLDGQLRDLTSMFLAAGGLLNMGRRPPLMMDSLTTSTTGRGSLLILTFMYAAPTFRRRCLVALQTFTTPPRR